MDDTDEVESSDYGSFGGFFHYQEPLCGQLHITDTEDWDLFLPYIDVYAGDNDHTGKSRRTWRKRRRRVRRVYRTVDETPAALLFAFLLLVAVSQLAVLVNLALDFLSLGSSWTVLNSPPWGSSWAVVGFFALGQFVARVEALAVGAGFLALVSASVGLSLSGSVLDFLHPGSSAETDRNMHSTEDETFQIFVLDMESHTLVLEVHPEDSVQAVQEAVHGRTATPPDQQRLLFGGRELLSDSTLSSCNIQRHSILDLRGRLMGGVEGDTNTYAAGAGLNVVRTGNNSCVPADTSVVPAAPSDPPSGRPQPKASKKVCSAGRAA